MATLIVVIILLLILAIMALMVGRKGLMEQQMTGNDIRSKEVQEAAEAGLEFGVAWAASNSIPWVGNSLICPGAAGCPVMADINATTTGEQYTLTQLVYSRSSATSEYIRVTALANGGAAGGDNSIEANASVYIKPGSLLSSEGSLPPPLVTSGCMTFSTGTPDIYSSWNDIDGDGIRDPGEMGEAIITSQPETDPSSGSMCLDYCGPGGGNADCSNTDNAHSHVDLHNGTLTNNETFPDKFSNPADADPITGPGGTIWEYYFDVTPSQYQAAASSTLSKAGGAYYVTSSSNWPGGTYGSPDNPVVAVFANGCPKPNGNTTFYGIIFMMDTNACVSDGMNGWGNVTVYGSIGVTGGIHQLNANIEIHGVGSGSGMNIINMIPINASKLPGTWNDFI
jgi:hypothetical protein